MLAVFDIEDRSSSKKLSPALLTQLGEYLEGQIAEQGSFRVVPKDVLRGQIKTEKQASYKECYD
ncbi:MAG: hypothetical protein KC933_41095, partial [Myxococcales bacterium]|nr:hypothetical protein [Myxococcales bacterium]